MPVREAKEGVDNATSLSASGIDYNNGLLGGHGDGGEVQVLKKNRRKPYEIFAVCSLSTRSAELCRIKKKFQLEKSIGAHTCQCPISGSAGLKVST